MRQFSCMIVAVFLSGCSVQVFRPQVVVDPNDAREISDQDIKKAFGARPQLRLPATLALYEMGPRDKALPRQMKQLRGVRTVYEVPALLVGGPRPDASRGRSMANHGRQVVVSLKKLRLLSARARSDVLVLSSTTVVRRAQPNWLMGFIPLLITGLVLPMNHVQVTVQREVLVLDVRNGYLYEHFKLERKARKRYVLSLALGSTFKRLANQLRDQLRGQTLKQLRAFLVRPQNRRVFRPQGVAKYRRSI
jgi:hypothetical protein